MASPWILVLDVGSSSARARLYDGDGVGADPGPDAQLAYDWRAGAGGAMELPAEELFDRLARVVDAALEGARRSGREVAAVATTTFWHSLLGLARGEPATPVYAWGDVRAAPTALRLRRRMDEAAMHRRTGCFLHPSYPAVKLAWLRERDPERFARVDAWVSFAEFVEERLFGRRRCSYSMASGTGLLDVRRLRWDAEALEMAGVAEAALSPLVDLGEPLRGLRAPFATRWPELAEVPWYPALGDGACANVGSGATGTERLGLTLGTTAAVRALWEPAGEVEVPESLWCYRLDGRRCVAGGALSNGGNVFTTLSGVLRLGPGEAWEAELAAMGPDAHGLTVLPYLLGERGPGWLRERSGAVVGLTQATSPVDLVRAWMEAVAYRIARVHARLEEALGHSAEIRASGGAIHASPVWAQILADALGCALLVTGDQEATSRGAALAVQESLGWRDDLSAAPAHPATVVRPDPSRHERYRAAMRRQDELQAVLSTFPRPATE